MSDPAGAQSRIRLWLALFITGLVLSGLTALPLEAETGLLVRWLGPGTGPAAAWPELSAWLEGIHVGVVETGRRFPFLAYGNDWLAFAHIVIAVAFVGAWRDPVRNVWVVQFGLVACALVIPTALGCGAVRGIPLFWRLLDCSFGVAGGVPLGISLRLIRRLDHGGTGPRRRATGCSEPR
jgi:hypothetical protein